MTRINGVLSADVADYWYVAEPWIESSLKHATAPVTTSQIREACSNQDAQLWLLDMGESGAFVTRIEIENDSTKTCALPFIGGIGLADWIDDVLALLEQFGLHHGCARMEGYGRKGWSKVLSSKGWETGRTERGNLKFTRSIGDGR